MLVRLFPDRAHKHFVSVRRLQRRPTVLESEALELVLARAEVARTLQHTSAANAWGNSVTDVLLKFRVLGEELLVKVLLTYVRRRDRARHNQGRKRRYCLHAITLIDEWYPVLIHRNVLPQKRAKVQPAEIRMRLDVAPAP